MLPRQQPYPNIVLNFDGRRLSGARPFAVFESKNGHWVFTVSNARTGTEQSGHSGVLAALRQALQWARSVSTRGAAMGFFAYDFARQLEPRAFTNNSPRDDLQIPDIRLVFFEELISSPQQAAPQEESKIQNPKSKINEEYSAAIARIHAFIAAGDIYQANFAERFSFPLPDSPTALYQTLRSTQAAPFGALLEWDDFSILSNSPELFLKLENGILTAQPIKGTAKRGSTLSEDEELKNALQRSIKNRAENVMIVDLLRNDLGRVCEYGSIEVPALFETRTFPTLHHLVSTVTGVLRPERDALDAFVAAFPCGSITGAPKIRAMQIIDELESTRRGASFGAIGYFGFDENMEWNVAIRTITCKDRRAHFHAGGGIVADSDARDEYAEMQLKAAALKQLLGAQQSGDE
jgi:para-aminobenzoate synthetase component 1